MYTGQLVYFEKNPDRGPCIVHHVAPSEMVEVEILQTGAKARASLNSLCLYPLPRGLQVLVMIENIGFEGVIIGTVEEDETAKLRTVGVQIGDKQLDLPEVLLRPKVARTSAPCERLAALQWDTPRAYCARRDMLLERNSWLEDAEGLPTLTGARIIPFAHQIYAARRVLFDPFPRYILADEVGLGKTIEAGLILQSFLAENPRLKVLIITPGAMTRQWFGEMYMRFGTRVFSICDDGIPGADKELVIVSASSLLRAKQHWDEIINANWDIVVIDEAHQFPPTHPLYALLQKLSQNAEGLLVLSATPSQRQTEGLLGLLSLVAPTLYPDPRDPTRLEELFQSRAEVWQRIVRLKSMISGQDYAKNASNPKFMESIARRWDDLARVDGHIAHLLKRMRNLDKTAPRELLLYVQEHYRVDHRILRTRRSMLEDTGHAWNERIFKTNEYEPNVWEGLLVEHVEEGLHTNTPDEFLALRTVYYQALLLTPSQCLQRLECRYESLENKTATQSNRAWFEEILLDPSPAERARFEEELLATHPTFEGESQWLLQAIEYAQEWKKEVDDAPCARHQAALDLVLTQLQQDPTAKILVFEAHRETLLEFANHLVKKLPKGQHAEVFHWTQNPSTEKQMNAASTKFQRDERHRVLVSDELGGEGRNFQMASCIVHLSESWNVSRMEQRTGRLDRVSRRPDFPINSQIILGSSRIESLIHKVHAHVFGVYQQSIAGLEFQLPVLQRQVSQGAAQGAHALSERLHTLENEISQISQGSKNDLDMALDISLGELERAAETQEILRSLCGDERQEFVIQWARALGISVKDKGNDEIRFKWVPNNLRAPLPGYPLDGEEYLKFYGTFNRNVALEREDLQFIAPGHKFYDALIAALECGHFGNLAIFGRPLGEEAKSKIHVQVLIQHTLDSNTWPNGPISAGLMARARRHLPDYTTETLIRLDENFDLQVLEPRDPAHRAAQQPWHYEDDQAIPLHVVAYKDFDQLVHAVRAAVEEGLEQGRQERAAYVEEARDLLEQELVSEISYFESQQTHGLSNDWQVHIQERRALLEHLHHGNEHVVGVALIMGV